jgi:hypothetical protein
VFNTWWERIGIESKTIVHSWQFGSQLTSIEDGRIFSHVNGSNSHTSRAIFVLRFGRLIMV